LSTICKWLLLIAALEAARRAIGQSWSDAGGSTSGPELDDEDETDEEFELEGTPELDDVDDELDEGSELAGALELTDVDELEAEVEDAVAHSRQYGTSSQNVSLHSTWRSW
jgi:hypothetical protein